MDEFDVNQCLSTYLFNLDKLSLLELCSYLGSVNCFKFLRTKFNSDITHHCLGLSFIGGNPDIISECLKKQKPNYRCMKYAIMSHNIDFVTYLIDVHNIKIDVRDCEYFNNLQVFFVYLDRTNDFTKCIIYSPAFNIPSVCEYFLSNSEHINDEEFHFLSYRKINYDIMTKLLLYFFKCDLFSD
ncbi:hypothetical protein TVAG_343070 [Trichomonas vaginalis G3]|uniref:DUF3447 domain-containing protein n=1 Tax=Trichomonas vaginalis (strain ATCC PRA-98 / G3) TaxID=412133 RepID=A2EJR9_TRIV3|nr:spectrin binding [Trichomonas vaginalis G3]EAY07143.1 hypothetical protein TVAG_343070 [Trichomonas vaginalis G3]KAI5522498.1 spectrin binding [Trichomonas vaginalis G3]|eukprot:XP_001319366.1 hypothetical protein [Trichomonas vaginalis G3]